MSRFTLSVAGAFPRKFQRATAVGVSALGLLAASPAANGDMIGPGFDLFRTAPSPPFPVSSVDLTVQSGGLVGIVLLKGKPFGPGDTDTIVERLAGIAPFPVGGPPVTIPIELVALSLSSVAPVVIGGSLFDMVVVSGSLLGRPGNPIGAMTISHSDPTGGTFITDFLPIDYKATFTEIGGPAMFDVFGHVDFFDTFGIWSHTPPPNDQHGGEFLSGGFYVQKQLMSHVTPDEKHYTQSAQPAPGALSLLALAGLTQRRRRRG